MLFDQCGAHSGSPQLTYSQAHSDYQGFGLVRFGLVRVHCNIHYVVNHVHIF